MTTDFSTMLPPMLFGDKLKETMTVLPEYDESVRQRAARERLLRLSDIYKIFVANDMAVEIYYKMYSMVSMSLQKKGTIESIRLLNVYIKGR